MDDGSEANGAAGQKRDRQIRRGTLVHTAPSRPRSWRTILARRRAAALDTTELFLATRPREGRLNWRHPLAVPYILLLVVLTPVLAPLAILRWAEGRLAERRHSSAQRRTKDHSHGR